MGETVISVKQINIYQGASVNSKLITTLPENSEFILTANYNGNGWMHIKPADKKKATFNSGWIQSGDVKAPPAAKDKGKPDGKAKSKGKK